MLLLYTLLWCMSIGNMHEISVYILVILCSLLACMSCKLISQNFLCSPVVFSRCPAPGVSAWVLFPLLILPLFFTGFLCVFEWRFVLPSVAAPGVLWWRSPAPAVFLYGSSLRRSWARSGRFCVVFRPAPRPADKEESPAARLPPPVVSKCALWDSLYSCVFSLLVAFTALVVSLYLLGGAVLILPEKHTGFLNVFQASLSRSPS